MQTKFPANRILRLSLFHPCHSTSSIIRKKKM